MTDHEYVNAVLARIGLPSLGHGGTPEEKAARDLYLPGIRGDYFKGRPVDAAAQKYIEHRQRRGVP